MATIHISEAIKQLFKDNTALQKVNYQQKISEIVKQKLGDFFIQKGVFVKDIKFKTLYLVCENASLKSELQLRKKELILHINHQLQENIIDDILLLNE